MDICSKTAQRNRKPCGSALSDTWQGGAPLCVGIANINLENLDWSRAHEMEFVRRMAVLRPILNDLAADVICLQEVAAQKPPPQVGRRFLALDRLLCDTAYQSYYRTTSVRPGTKRQSRIFVQQMKTKWGAATPPTAASGSTLSSLRNHRNVVNTLLCTKWCTYSCSATITRLPICWTRACQIGSHCDRPSMQHHLLTRTGIIELK